MKTTRQIGNIYENLAVQFLKNQGYKIIDRNFRSYFGEIDIIAREREYTCFIEVKGRKSDLFGEPQEFVINKKQQRIRRTAEYYAFKNKLQDTAMRFDVVSIIGIGKDAQIQLFKAAFE